MVWLQASQSPALLARLVGPPLCHGMVARHSFSCPVSRAAMVRGISDTRALASPRRREPRLG